MITFHNTIQRYLFLVLNVFNDLKICHKDNNGTEIVHSVPIVLKTREKMKVLTEYTHQQLLNGNTNVLPRAYLSLEAMASAPDRLTNKNQYYHQRLRTGSRPTIEYSYNSVAYDFNMSLSVKCRGYTDAFQIVEQVAVMFNPTINLDCWDSLCADEPTRIPLTCDGFDIMCDEFEESSTSIVTVNFAMTLHGWLYQPIKTASAIDDVVLNVGKPDTTYTDTGIELRTIFDLGNEVEPIRIQKLEPLYNYSKGDKMRISVVCTADKRSRLSYRWDCSPNVTIEQDEYACTILTSADDKRNSFEIAVTVTDQFGHEETLKKRVRAKSM